MISNIAAGNREQIQAIIDSKVVELLVTEIVPTATNEVQKEALWVIANVISGGSTEQVEYLMTMHEKFLPVWSSVMTHQKDERILFIVLEVVSKLLATSSMLPGNPWSSILLSTSILQPLKVCCY